MAFFDHDHLRQVLISGLLFLSCRVSTRSVERLRRDLVFENMVMRTHNSTTRKQGLKPVVGGGILERKIIIASNGTQRTHHESRGESRLTFNQAICENS